MKTRTVRFYPGKDDNLIEYIDNSGLKSTEIIKFGIELQMSLFANENLYYIMNEIKKDGIKNIIKKYANKE